MTEKTPVKQSILDNLFNTLKWENVEGGERLSFFKGKKVVKIELVDAPLIDGVILYIQDKNEDITAYNLDFYVNDYCTITKTPITGLLKEHIHEV